MVVQVAPAPQLRRVRPGGHAGVGRQRDADLDVRLDHRRQRRAAALRQDGAVTQFSGYLTDEVVEDYSDGVIGRREALRRLGLLGVAVAAAAPLLAACDAGRPEDAAPAAGGTAASPAGTVGPAGRGDHVRRSRWPHAPGRLGRRRPAARRGARRTREPRPHRPHPLGGRPPRRQRLLGARRRPALRGGRHRRRSADEGKVTAALNGVPDSRFVADMKAALDEIQRRTPARRLGAVGFCFGGGMVWTLLASGEPRLAAAAPFYGPLPDGADFARLPQRGGPRRVRRAGRPGQRHPRRGHPSAGVRRADPRDRHLSRTPATPSSTTPARGSARRPRRPRTRSCSAGSAITSADRPPRSRRGRLGRCPGVRPRPSWPARTGR